MDTTTEKKKSKINFWKNRELEMVRTNKKELSEKHFGVVYSK